MPTFRNRNHFRLPTVRIGPVALAIAACLVVAGLVVLAVVDPKPPLRAFEVAIPSERFAR